MCVPPIKLTVGIILLPVAIVGAGITSPVWGYHYHKYNKIIDKWYAGLSPAEQSKMNRIFSGKPSAGKLKRLYASNERVNFPDSFKFFGDCRLCTPFRGTSNEQKIINVLEFFKKL